MGPVEVIWLRTDNCLHLKSMWQRSKSNINIEVWNILEVESGHTFVIFETKNITNVIFPHCVLFEEVLNE